MVKFKQEMWGFGYRSFKEAFTPLMKQAGSGSMNLLCE